MIERIIMIPVMMIAIDSKMVSHDMHFVENLSLLRFSFLALIPIAIRQFNNLKL